MEANVWKWGKMTPFAHIYPLFCFPWSRGADAALGNGFLGVLGDPLGTKTANALQNHFLMKSG